MLWTHPEKLALSSHRSDALAIQLPSSSPIMEGLGKIGYVANSPYTVIGESMSGGRLYDKIGDAAVGEVVFVTTQGILCRVCKKSLLDNKKSETNSEE